VCLSDHQGARQARPSPGKIAPGLEQKAEAAEASGGARVLGAQLPFRNLEGVLEHDERLVPLPLLKQARPLPVGALDVLFEVGPGDAPDFRRERSALLHRQTPLRAVRLHSRTDGEQLTRLLRLADRSGPRAGVLRHLTALLFRAGLGRGAGGGDLIQSQLEQRPEPGMLGGLLQHAQPRLRRHVGPTQTLKADKQDLP
jgi:hypothetical protein